MSLMSHFWGFYLSEAGQLPVGYDISPLKRVQLIFFNHKRLHNPHGQLKENLFLPLFNTNFISKSFGGPIHNSVARTRGKARDILIL